MNLLRLGLLLVLVGFFAPVGCELNGYQIAQGILGHTTRIGNATLLAPVPDFFGYLLFGVFILALAGLIITFLTRVQKSFLLGFLCLAVSFVMVVVVTLKFKAMREETVRHFLVTLFRIKVNIQIGGYSMGAGYLAGAVGFILNTFKITK